MYLADHGGHCCGVRHIVGFGDLRDLSLTRQKEIVRSQIARISSTNNGRLVEACVTDQQMARNPLLQEVLDACGFVNVSSFRNSNSGNTVHVFHAMANGTSRAPAAPKRINRLFNWFRRD